MKKMNLLLNCREKFSKDVVDKTTGEPIPFNEYYFSYLDNNTNEEVEFRLKPADQKSKILIKGFFANNVDESLPLHCDLRFAVNSTGSRVPYYLFAVAIEDKNFPGKCVYCNVLPFSGEDYTEYILQSEANLILNKI